MGKWMEKRERGKRGCSGPTQGVST